MACTSVLLDDPSALIRRYTRHLPCSVCGRCQVGAKIYLQEYVQPTSRLKAGLSPGLASGTWVSGSSCKVPEIRIP